MTSQHPITPPPELVQEWYHEANLSGVRYENDACSWAYEQHIANRAAQWGADQELEACCEWLHWQNLATHQDLIPSLRTARRPKPPSLKEQALAALAAADGADHPVVATVITADQHATIRRALEALPE